MINGIEGLKTSRLERIKKRFIKCRYLHLMAIPGLLFFIIFKYTPMYGLIIAFKHYVGSAGGFDAIMNARWVGFQNFEIFFNSMYPGGKCW